MSGRRPRAAASSRRRVLAGGLAALAAGPVALRVGPARATSPAAAAALKAIIGDARVVAGGIVLDAPMLAETGNAVPISVAVPAAEAPGAARVESLHIVLDRNPEPVAASVRFGPAAGRPALATRLRFFARQNVVAVARLADGTARVARQHVEITLAACIDQEEI